MNKKKISPERKTAYYIGLILMGVGFLLFLSVFVTGALNMGSTRNFDSQMSSSAIRAVGGMVLMIAGAVIRRIGVRGLAGSGVILDPDKAREDIEPWARMAGGIVKDAVEETGLKINRSSGKKEMPFDEKLRRLNKLYQDGIITEEEYEGARREVLDRT